MSMVRPGLRRGVEIDVCPYRDCLSVTIADADLLRVLRPGLRHGIGDCIFLQ